MKYAVLLLPLNELMDGMLFADGDETISLTANLLQGVMKIILSVVLCQRIGVKGLALASSISFLISILISSLHFLSPGNTLRVNLAFSLATLWDILKYGIVDASTYLFLFVFSYALNFFVLGVFGSEMLVLVSVVTLVKQAQVVFEGIGEAITPLISIYYGEECYPGIQRVWKLAQWSLVAISLVSGGFLFVFAPFITSLLGATDVVTTGYMIWGLRILSLTLVFTGRLFLDSSYFILVDEISLGVLVSFLRDLFPALPLAVLGGLLGGIYGMYIGLMAAPALGYFISVLYIKRKYGKESYPLLLADTQHRKTIHLYEFLVSPAAIIDVRDQMGALMRDYDCSDGLINRAMLLFEELFMLIYDYNPGKVVLAECSVELGESIRLVTKDDGQIVDLTDTDHDISSLRSYALSNLLESHTTRRVHSLAVSYNRNVLEIR